MFDYAPSELFAPDSLPERPNDFYLRSEQISSGEENLATITELSVRLTHFGTCKGTANPKLFFVNLFPASWFDKHLTEWIQPPMLRAPEVIIGASWDFRVDIWNLGALVSIYDFQFW